MNERRRGFLKWEILREEEEEEDDDDELICDETMVEEDPTWLSEAEAMAKDGPEL